MVPKSLKERLTKEILNDLENLDKKFDTVDIKIQGYKPSNREIRLAQELIDMMYPLYKHADPKTKAEFVLDTFKYDTTIDHILKVKPFKKILFKKVFVGVKPTTNGKYEILTKRVRIR